MVGGWVCEERHDIWEDEGKGLSVKLGVRV